MKTELKAKLLQHLVAKKQKDEGFTLIELLVVIIIIGILAAIALPSFLNQANRARQSEAQSYIGSLNRAQQAYRLEKASFAPDIAALKIGLSDTANYNYASAGVDANNAKSTAIATEDSDSELQDVLGTVTVAAGVTTAKLCLVDDAETTDECSVDAER